jgi:hypothetical protein
MTNSKVVVFLGPSLPVSRAKELLPGGVFLPPARQGDLYRAARDRRPTAIGLIDGLFATAPAVWHREILWAMAEARIAVFGGASMGALRAAELDAFGMIGIGKIYESYRCGQYAPFAEPFEDDDEVAVRHAPPEVGSLPVSDAMVDLRETLFAAETASVIGIGTRDSLAHALKNLHFAERSFIRLATMAASLRTGEGAELAAWLRAGHAVSQKRRDAEAVLRRMSADARPLLPIFVFERALVWERFRHASDASAPGPLSEAAE